MNTADNEGMTPIGLAFQRGHPKSLEALVEMGAEPSYEENKSGGITLIESAVRGYAKAVKIVCVSFFHCKRNNHILCKTTVM